MGFVLGIRETTVGLYAIGSVKIYHEVYCYCCAILFRGSIIVPLLR